MVSEYSKRVKRFETKGPRKMRVFIVQTQAGQVFLVFPSEMKETRKANK